MRALSQDEWEVNYAPALQAVFRRLDPFDAPLQDSVAGRALLYPVHFTLDERRYEAVFAAAQLVGDTEVCVSIVEGSGQDDPARSRHWLLSQWDYDEYRELPDLGVLENALYSPAGHWGLLISHELHAIVGGSQQVVRKIAKAFDATEMSVDRFLAYWDEVRRRGTVSTDWVPALLAHLRVVR